MNPDQEPDIWEREKFRELPELPASHDKPSAKGLAPIILILLTLLLVGLAIGWFGCEALNQWLALP